MTGAAGDQAIWIKVPGGFSTVTLETLWYAYLNDTLGNYSIVVMDPINFTVSWQGINRVIYQGLHQRVVVTQEDGQTVTLGADGKLLDIADWHPNVEDKHPVHAIGKPASECKHQVCAVNPDRDQPGDKIHVRKVVNYVVQGSCPVFTIPTPNMMSDQFFVILS